MEIPQLRKEAITNVTITPQALLAGSLPLAMTPLTGLLLTPKTCIMKEIIPIVLA